MTPAMHAWVSALGWALLHFVWQGALIGCASAIGLAILRNARPQARYAFCSAALLLCVLLPVWHLSGSWVQGVPAGETVISAADAPAQAFPSHVVTLTSARLEPGLTWLVALWGAGALAMLLRMTLGLAWVQRMGSVAGSEADPAWQARLDALARRMGLTRLPRLCVLAKLDGPITVGNWRPLVLVPAALLTSMPIELIEALLAHELAHVRRFDYLANLLQSMVEVLLFYHPVVWWLSRRIRIEREEIADDLAARILGEPRRLALALSELAQYQHAHSQQALAAHGGSLMSRITRLVRPTSQPLGWKPLLPITGLAALVIAAHASGLPASVNPTVHAPATTATPTKQPTVNSIKVSDAVQRFTYALVSAKDGSNIMAGTSQDVREVEAARASLGSDFLWVRQDNQRYVVTDPATLAKAQALWGPVKAIAGEMDKLGLQMDAQGQEAERIGQEAAAAHGQARQAAKVAAAAEIRAAQQQLAAARAQQSKTLAAMGALRGKLAAAQNDKQQAELQAQLDQLENALDPQEAAIDALTERIDHVVDVREQALHAALDEREQAAQGVMNGLESQMAALEHKQDAAQKTAEQQLKVLIQDAIQRGLGKQAGAQPGAKVAGLL